MKALAEDPADRYQTVAAMEQAMAGLTTRGDTTVRPSPAASAAAPVRLDPVRPTMPAPAEPTGEVKRLPARSGRLLAALSSLLVAAVAIPVGFRQLHHPVPVSPTATARPTPTSTPIPTVPPAAGPVAFGPVRGVLYPRRDGLVSSYRASTTIGSFDAFVRFYNPYSAASLPWDYGFEFRQGANNTQYRLEVKSNGYWYLYFGPSNPLASGPLTNLHTAPDGHNDVRIIVTGTTAVLYLNGSYQTSLTLSVPTVAGPVRGPGLGEGPEPGHVGLRLRHHGPDRAGHAGGSVRKRRVCRHGGRLGARGERRRGSRHGLLQRRSGARPDRCLPELHGLVAGPVND